MKDLINEVEPFPAKNSLSLPPGDWQLTCGLDPQSLGILAQAYISNDFLQKTRISFSDCCFDDSFAGPIDRNLVAFICRKNPKISENVKGLMNTKFGKRPDILIHTNHVLEYYEIKPYSIDGILKADKLDAIQMRFKEFGLPYKLGISFKPDPIILICRIPRDGYVYEYSFIVALNRPGLIVYKFCIATNSQNNITFTKDRSAVNYFKEYIYHRLGSSKITATTLH